MTKSAFIDRALQDLTATWGWTVEEIAHVSEWMSGAYNAGRETEWTHPGRLDTHIVPILGLLTCSRCRERRSAVVLVQPERHAASCVECLDTEEKGAYVQSLRMINKSKSAR